MPTTYAQFIEMQERCDRHKKRQIAAVHTPHALREVGRGGLQEQIADWCRKQWPPVKFLQARSDRASTIAVGAQDFTLFLSGGRVLCLECKARNEKRTPEQNIWAKEMEMNGHAVHLVRSIEEFKALV